MKRMLVYTLLVFVAFYLLYEYITVNKQQRRKNYILATKQHTTYKKTKRQVKQLNQQKQKTQTTKRTYKLKTAELKSLLENFDALEDPISPEGKKVSLTVRKILYSTDPRLAVTDIKNILKNTNDTNKKRYFIQLAYRLQLSDAEKLEFFKEVATNNKFFRKDFDTPQEYHTAEIAIKALKSSIKTEDTKKELSKLRNLLQNQRLQKLLDIN